MTKLKAGIAALRNNKIVFALTVAAFVLSPLYLTLMAEWFQFRHLFALVEFVTKTHTPRFLFALSLTAFVVAAMWLVTRRMWAAVGAVGTLYAIAALVNYFKSSLTGDNFYPRDIVMAGNMGEVAGFVSIPAPVQGVVLLIGFVSLTAFLAVFGKRSRLPLWGSLLWGAAMFAALFAFFGDYKTAEKVFNKFDIYFESAALESNSYSDNGFIAAFSLGIAQYSINKPDGYSPDALNDFLSRYGETPATQTPDVVLVLSESFWDPKNLPFSEFSENPFANYDRLTKSENAISGRLFVPTFGGGTIRTEFEVLTGLTMDALPGGIVPYNVMRTDIPSYISRYRDIGYETRAVHTYLAGFYNRDVCLPLLGVGDYKGQDELTAIAGVDWSRSGGQINDASFARYVEWSLNQAASPMFLFGISMEGHQPYNNKYKEYDITTENPKLNEGDADRFRNYTQAMKHADQSLGELAAFIDKRERPTVLVWFGDHLPSIGVSYSAFLDTGYVETTWQEPDRYKLYGTPFIVYANFPLETGMFGVRENAEISSYNLMNAVASAMGGGSNRYMGFLRDLYDSCGYYNVRLNKPIGDETRQLLKYQYFATYERVTGK